MTCFHRATFASWELWLLRRKLPVDLRREVWKFVGFQPKRFQIDHTHEQNSWQVIYNKLRQWEYAHKRIVPAELFRILYDKVKQRAFVFSDMITLQRGYDEEKEFLIMTFNKENMGCFSWPRKLMFEMNWKGELDWFIQRPFIDVKESSREILHYVKTPHAADWFLCAADRALIERFG